MRSTSPQICPGLLVEELAEAAAEALRTCPCGRSFLQPGGPGRPRVYCERCRRPPRDPKPERACECGCGTMIPAGGKARFASRNCQQRAWRRRQGRQKQP